MPLDDDARRRAAETKRRRTRQKLVDAVRELDANADWVGNVTMAAVAEKAGVSEATAYRYYRNIREVRADAIAGVRERTEEWREELRHCSIELVAMMGMYFAEEDVHRYSDYIRELIEADPEIKPLVADYVLDLLLNYKR